MNIVNLLQELDNLIIEHTKPPITTKLRNKLSLALEQAEAHSEAVIKQDRTLATQIETIDRLMKKNQELNADIAQRNTERIKVGVTLNDGTRRMYDANAYQFIPNKNAPQIVEFRMLDKAKNTFREVAHVRFSEIKEVHGPSS